eukprot:Rhum_TRINITY_DN7580_c0_g1::Rhum_TRINITY_DN7580_c0_g1_i1::g.23549::m.23549
MATSASDGASASHVDGRTTVAAASASAENALPASGVSRQVFGDSDLLADVDGIVEGCGGLYEQRVGLGKSGADDSSPRKAVPSQRTDAAAPSSRGAAATEGERVRVAEISCLDAHSGRTQPLEVRCETASQLLTQVCELFGREEEDMTLEVAG